MTSNATRTVQTPVHLTDHGTVVVDLRPLFEQSARNAVARLWAQVPTFAARVA